MKKYFILLVFVFLSNNIFSVDFSFNVENSNWEKKLEGDARNFIGPFLFFDKKNESLIYLEIEEIIQNTEENWIILVERNFDNSIFEVSFLTEQKNNIHQLFYKLRNGKISKEINIIKHHSLKKIVGYKDNYHFVYDANSFGESQYYLFINKNNVLKSYAFYGKGYSSLEIKQIRKIQKKIDKNVYELIKYLLTL